MYLSVYGNSCSFPPTIYLSVYVSIYLSIWAGRGPSLSDSPDCPVPAPPGYHCGSGTTPPDSPAAGDLPSPSDDCSAEEIIQQKSMWPTYFSFTHQFTACVYVACILSRNTRFPASISLAKFEEQQLKRTRLGNSS